MKVATLFLTGFLGAGKTTLLNRLIAARAAGPAAAGKLAIIVNELGAVGVDGDLLPRGAARQVELPGGCVCCVLSGDLDRTVLELLERNPEVDTLVLETTGVAEPLPITWILEREPLASRLRVAAIVTLVDPTSFAAARATSVAAEIQVEAADVLLLTKGDVTTADERASTRAAVAALAPATPVLEGTAAEQVAWLSAVLADPSPALARRAPAPAVPACDLDHDHAAHEHADGAAGGDDHAHGGHEDGDGHGDAARDPAAPTAHGVTAVAVPAPDVVDLEQLEDELSALPPGYFRVKGIVRAVDPRRDARAVGWAAVHRVGARVSSEPIDAPAEPARLVALGRAVDAAALTAALSRPTGRTKADSEARRGVRSRTPPWSDPAHPVRGW